MTCRPRRAGLAVGLSWIMLEARVQQGGVADLYRKIAPVYDLWAQLTESRARDRCLELAGIRDGEAVVHDGQSNSRP